MKVLINLIRGVLVLLWVLILAVNVRLYTDENQSGHVPPQLGGYAPWTVADGQMEPELKKGDLAMIQMDQMAQPGDKVLFRREDGGLGLSRIIGTSEGRLILKADNADESAFVEPNVVEGLCVTYLPGFGPAAEFLRSLPGLVLIAILGLVLIVLPGVTPRAGRGGRPGGSHGPVRPVEPVRSTRGASKTRGSRGGGYTPRH